MQTVNCFSIVSTKGGEIVFDHCVCNDASGIPVAGDFFPVNPTILGRYETIKVITRTGEKTALKSIDLDSGRIGHIPKTLSWTVEIDEGDGKISTEEYVKPVTTLVLLKGPKLERANRTNVRCPMPSSYWQKMVKLERSGAEDIRDQKDIIRKEYEFDFDITKDGCKVILPDPMQRDSNSYLIAMADQGMFEFILSRRSRLPNAYRIECDNGKIQLINPRTEITLQGE